MNGPIDIYTDGSAFNSPTNRAGGLGYVILNNGIELTGSLGYYKTTNNRMEFLAIILPLEEIQTPTEINVYTDSEIVINSMTKWRYGWEKNGWKTRDKKPVTNVDLIVRLRDVMNFHQLKFHKVKSHTDNFEVGRNNHIFTDVIHEGQRVSSENVHCYYNDLADHLAGEAAKHPTETDFKYLDRK